MIKKSQFNIDAKDSPTEEQIIRNPFKGPPEVEDLGFDLMKPAAHSQAPFRRRRADRPRAHPSWHEAPRRCSSSEGTS